MMTRRGSTAPFLCWILLTAADQVTKILAVNALKGKDPFILIPGVLQLQGKKYQVHGNLIRSEKEAESDGFLGITYWLDITEYDDIRLEYEQSRPVPGIVVIDNLDELCKNLPERARTDLRDEVEDKLHHWCEGYHGILRRYDRDRYFVMFEKRDLDGMREEKFRIIEEVHKVESPNGISASISVVLTEVPSG